MNARSTSPPASPRPRAPPRAGEKLPEPVRKVLAWVGRPEVRLRFLSSLVLAGSFVALIDLYTHGRLLYGVDYVGIYTPSGFFLNPSVNYVVPAVASGLTFGDIYSAQYLGFFLDTFLTVFACQSFARELFRVNFGPRGLLAVEGLSAVLYLVNPYNMTWGLISITTAVFVSGAAFFVVMQMTVRFVRRTLGRGKFGVWDAVILGVAVGCSAPVSFPNVVRVLAVEGIAFAVALGGVWYFGTRPEQRTALRRGVVTTILAGGPVAALLLAYPVYTFASVWFAHPGALSSVESQFTSTLSNTTYNTFGNVVRLLSRRQFYRFSYYPLYTGYTAVGLASYLWPVVAVLTPVCLAVFQRDLPGRKMILVVEGVVLAGLIWANGTLPPFGPLNSIVLTPFPLMTTIVPTFFLEALLETRFYAVLGAFTIVTLAARAWEAGRAAAPAPEAESDPAPVLLSPTIRRAGGIAVSFALVGLLLLAALPIFDGAAEVDSIGAFVPGFEVPSSYTDVRNILHTSGSNALLLPGVSPYIQTSWGFEGATLFYLSFNYPNKVVVPGFYGAYQIYLPTTSAAYSSATRPLVPAAGNGTGTVPLNFVAANLVNQLPNYNYRIGTAVNASGHAWVQLRLHYAAGNASAVAALLASGTLWVGLRSHTGNSPSSVGWYIVSPTYDVYLRVADATDTQVDLLVNQSSSGGGYDPSNISAVSLWIHQPGLAVGTQLPFAPISLANLGGSVVAGSWVGQMASYNVRYVLVDQSIVRGATEPTSYANSTVAALEAEALATPTYLSPDLQLYQLVFAGPQAVPTGGR